MAAPISTTYTFEERENIIAHVLAEIATGRALSRILREDKGMPVSTTWWRWHSEDEELQHKVARAREAGVEALMMETIDIADTQEVGQRVTTKPDGTIETVEEDMIAHRKLRIESRFKYAQMIAPRKYGPKVDVTSGGEALPTPAPVLVDARIQSLIALAQARHANGELAAPDDDLGDLMS